MFKQPQMEIANRQFVIYTLSSQKDYEALVTVEVLTVDESQVV